MKRLVLFCLLCSFVNLANARISFSFSVGSIDEGTLKIRMENNISTLLTEIHHAGSEGRPLNLDVIQMESAAKQHLIALWEILPFVCNDKSNICQCLNDYQGFQVRGIRILMKPKDSSYSQSVHRELTLSLNRSGQITGVRPALEMQESITRIMGNAKEVKDVNCRREILKWVEDFRNYYNERDINSIRQIYSDDALIITGSVVKTVRTVSGDGNVMFLNNVKYSVRSKDEYIENLTKVFSQNRYVNVKFDKIKVARHAAKRNIYGVTLHQSWWTSNYSDEGWLFLLWDFNVPDKPQIHVRTWQPEYTVAEDEVFTLNDFFIP